MLMTGVFCEELAKMQDSDSNVALKAILCLRTVIFLPSCILISRAPLPQWIF